MCGGYPKVHGIVLAIGSIGLLCQPEQPPGPSHPHIRAHGASQRNFLNPCSSLQPQRQFIQSLTGSSHGSSE